MVKVTFVRYFIFNQTWNPQQTAGAVIQNSDAFDIVHTVSSFNCILQLNDLLVLLDSINHLGRFRCVDALNIIELI